MKKKILLSAICFALFGLAVNAQMPYKNREDTNLGFLYETKSDTIILDYNFNLSDSYKSKDYVTKLQSNNGKGFWMYGVTENFSQSFKAPFSDAKTNSHHSGIRVYHVTSIEQLRDSLMTGDQSKDQKFWKTSALAFDVPGSDGADQAFAMYTGMARKNIFAIDFKFSDNGWAGLISDLSFDILTLDAGNSGFQKTYKLVAVPKSVSIGGINGTFGNWGTSSQDNARMDIALLDTISEANVSAINSEIGSNFIVVDSIYTTGLSDSTGLDINRENIKLAEKLGISYSEFRNKEYTAMLYSSEDNAYEDPFVYQPVIGIDNMTAMCTSASWIVPENIEANAIDTADAVIYKQGDTTEFTLNFIDKNRFSSFKIGSDGALATSRLFKVIKLEKMVNGVYADITDDAHLTQADGTNKMSLYLDAPTGENPVNDTIKLTMQFRYIPQADTLYYRFEVDNGVRFWYDIPLVQSGGNEVHNPSATQVGVITNYGSVSVYNAEENVSIVDMSGNEVSDVTPSVAASGIPLNAGSYIVKTGDFTEKVIVK